MANKTPDHAGSGIDKPDPKTLGEKISDGIKKIIPEKPRGPDRAPPSDVSEVAPNIVPPAD